MIDPNYTQATEIQRQFTLQKDDLRGKTIAITGATGGLGTELSKSLANAGASVVLISRNEKKLEKLYDVLIADGAATPAIVPIEQGKANEAAYQELAALIYAEFGGLDALVHTAADLGTPTPMTGISHQEWMRVMSVNLTSARLLSLAVLPLLKVSPLASMVFLLDHKPSAYWGGYGVSKQAIQSMMHMLAHENDQIVDDSDGFPQLAINGLNPGPMRTQLRRRAFPGEQEDESPLPELALGTLNWLITRQDRALTNKALLHST